MSKITIIKVGFNKCFTNVFRNKVENSRMLTGPNDMIWAPRNPLRMYEKKHFCAKFPEDINS